jgi:Fe-S-cluster-containing dehydrogenase component
MKHEQKHNPPMWKYGMAIDLDKCTGCGACMVACMSENNIPFKEDESDKLVSITWMRFSSLPTAKSFPGHGYLLLSRGPASTAKAMAAHSPCVSVCPATATDYSRRRASSARSIPAVSDAATAWVPAPTTPGISTGGIRSGPTAWKST